jgi:hypothetical protein
MSVRPTSIRANSLRRLLTIALYLGCFVAVVFILRPILFPDTPPSKSAKRFPTPEKMPFLLPEGNWNFLTSHRLSELSRDVASGLPVSPGSIRSSLLPAGVVALAERADGSGRVSAFLTADEDPTKFAQHWANDGWELLDTAASEQSPRTIALNRGSERAFAWVFPSAEHAGRCHLLVTITETQTEDRP